jgi:hypothetical protein
MIKPIESIFILNKINSHSDGFIKSKRIVSGGAARVNIVPQYKDGFLVIDREASQNYYTQNLAREDQESSQPKL